jgi:hypothetical protein
MKDEKYTLGESALVFGLEGLTVLAITVLFFPVSIAVAWMRATIWNWYCPMLHLPPVSVWLMLVAGFFVSMFMPCNPTLKDDLLKFKSWQSSLFMILGQVLVFGIVAIVHVWFK